MTAGLAGGGRLTFAPQRAVPVFPLPGFVLFPHVTAPLHVFELRYRTLVRDTLRAERLLATALVKPGRDRHHEGSPEFFEIGCLARVAEVQWRPDDCYDIKVVGVSRVRFQRVTRDYPYCSVNVSLLPQNPLPEGDPLVELERRALIEAYARAGRQPAEAPSFEALVNGLCLEMAMDASDKLALLQLDCLLERARRIRERIESEGRHPEGPGGSSEHN